MYVPKTRKERLQHRLKIVQGHLKKVQSMVDMDEYCINIIHQSQAIQSALREFDSIMLEGHLKGCVVDSIRDGKVDEAVLEVMNVFKNSKKL